MSQESVEQLPKSTRRIWVAKKILQLIFTGEFKGGDRLIEEEVAEKIGVSRTPVREALGELAGIGVIRLKPNHGAIVREFGAKQIREIYHIRNILEAEATRLAEEINRYRTLVQSIREAVGNIQNAQDFALIEHTLIIDLLLDHQGQRAAEVMSQHIERGAEVAAAALSNPKPPAV